MKRFEHAIAVLERARLIHEQTLVQARNDMCFRDRLEETEELAKDIRDGIAELVRLRQGYGAAIEKVRGNYKTGENR